MPYYILPPKFDIEALLARAVSLFIEEFGRPPKSIAVDLNEEFLVVDGVRKYEFVDLIVDADNCGDNLGAK